MNILILGATGFIGNAIFQSLTEHHITIASRSPIDGYEHWKRVDFNGENKWQEILTGVDLVINAIGIIEGDYHKIQTEEPIKLYAECQKKNIKVIHISAIGAEKEHPATTFLATKKITDEYLLQHNQAKVIYPGVVIGKNGKSSQFFTELAQFPIIPIFNNHPLPLTHINQLTRLIHQIVENFDAFSDQIVALAEPETLQDLFIALKGKKPVFLKMPNFVFSILFTVFPKLSIGIFNVVTFKMLQDVNLNDYAARFEKTTEHISAKNNVKSDVFPQLFALLAISFIWLWSGISSLVDWDSSYQIMKEVGANDQLAVLSIYAGSLVDILLGIVLFSKKYRKQVLVVQVVFMLIYMGILSITAPHYWLHPFGVLSKNIPLLALSFYLYQKQKN